MAVAEGVPLAAPAGGEVLRESPVRRFFGELRASPKGITGFVIVSIVLLTTAFVPYMAPHDPAQQVIANRFLPPAWADGGSWSYVLGGDNLGRDIFSRVLVGTQASIAMGFLVVATSMIAGSLLGAIAGYFGGFADALIMRTVDFQLAFPFILIAIVFMAVLGPGMWSTFVALSVAIWVNYARLVRGEALKLRELDYIQAARCIGVGSGTIVLRHVIPNVLPVIIVMATLDVAWVIIFEAALSFLGLGVQPPTPSWGVMISEGRNYLYDSHWMTLGPGLAILITSVGINLLGDFLRDTYDPRLARL
jgi:ABC-type dipeptide/oligopeptide/nickel transport system permease subunit